MWFCRSMASSGDPWVREYNEAVKLADDITSMISERNSLPATGPEAQRHVSAIRRKITILSTRLESLESLHSRPPGKQLWVSCTLYFFNTCWHWISFSITSSIHYYQQSAGEKIVCSTFCIEGGMYNDGNLGLGHLCLKYWRQWEYLVLVLCDYLLFSTCQVLFLVDLLLHLCACCTRTNFCYPISVTQH